MWLEIIGVFIAVTISVKLLLESKQKILGKSSKKKTIPGMKPSDPETGNKTELKSAKTAGHFISELHKKYGPIASFWEGKKLAVSISEPRMFKQVKHLFLTSVDIFEEFKLLMEEDALPFCEIEEIRRRRKLYEQHFMLKACKSYAKTFSQIANEFIKKWEKLDKDEKVPLTAITARASLTAMSRTTYGDIFEDEKKLDRFHELSDYIFHHLFPAPTPGGPVYNQIIENREELKAFVKEAIQRRKQTKHDDDERLFIDVLLEENFTEKQCLADGFVMITAGYQTTATHMTWTLFHLCKNPDIQEKLYQEITSVAGNDPINMELVSEMKYLKQVLEESLRHFVYYGFTGRTAHEDLEIDGYFIPKGTTIYAAVGCPFQNANNFPNPEKFDPDHFSEENVRSRNGFTFKPFGFAGKRQCLGQTFAMAEGSIFLAEWCRRFRFRLASGQSETVETTPMFQPEGEIYINLEKRN